MAAQKIKLSRFLIFVIIFIVGIQSSLNAAIPPPQLRCVSVAPNSSIALSWATPAGNPAEFINYTIFSSTFPNGPYLPLDSILNFNQQTYIDPASVGNIYYFMVTKFDDGSGVQYSLPSDTLKNIVLNVTSASGTNLPPLLNWNPLHTPNIPTSFGEYYIYRKKTFSGSWVLIDSTNYGTENYIDNSIVVCSDTLYYRVEIADSLPCISVSTEGKALFRESTPPSIPQLDSASIDTSTGIAKIGWQPSTSPDVAGYLIFYNNNGTWVHDTVMGPMSQYFEKLNVNGNLGALTFSIAAFDTCGNVSANGNSHTTMFANANENLCNRTIRLEWSAYQGKASLTGYDIIVSQDNLPFRFLASVAANNNVYTHENLQATSRYCYVVIARGPNFSSTSNIVCASFQQLQAPLYHYTPNVSVIDNQIVEITCHTDTSAEIEYYTIWRSTTQSGPYQQVGLVEVPTDTFFTFYDSTAHPNQTSYFYFISAMDSCDKAVSKTNLSRTIFIHVQDDAGNFVHNLSWNRYYGWDSLGFGVQKYRIEQSIGDEPIRYIDTVGPGVFDYLSPYYDQRADGSTFCYRIEAQENNGNIYDFKTTSSSNLFCIVRDYRTYIPNIFSPNRDGKNDVFLPEIQFVDAQNYSMIIYDRWGREVFLSSDPRIGWDGNIGVNQAPMGSYVYLIKFVSGKGAPIEIKGGITLIR